MSSIIPWAMRSLLLLTLLLTSCGARKTSVSGTVVYNRKPLPSGTVLFHGEDGRVAHSLIDENGNYTIDNPPLGLVRITVRSHAAMPAGMPSSGRPPESPSPPAQDGKASSDTYVPIPKRYLAPDQSGLTYTVQVGPQTHHIELSP